MGAITAEGLATRIREDDWKRLLDRGLGVSCHCELVAAVEHRVETIEEDGQENGDAVHIIRKRTPEGEIHKVTRNG